MRVEPYRVGSFVHVYNQGNRKQPIVLDEKDWWRFLLMLRYFNDEYSPPNFTRALQDLRKSDFRELVEWPENWPPHNPLVNIVCFVLMENHYHLILEEIKKAGITRFMHKLGTGMTNYFNIKHNLDGRLFRGAFKLKRIDIDEYLTYLSVYIQVKNLFERYPGGLKKATAEFDKAFDWGLKDPYCSLADYAGHRNSPIIEKSVLGKMFSSPEEYRDFAKQCILGMNLDLKIGKLGID